MPLLIELRSYAGLCADGKCDTFLEYLEYLGETEGWHLTKNALHQHLKNDGRAVVIFDGLDEIFDPEGRERIARQIAGFVSDYPKARIVATSRIIGYRRAILSAAGFAHFTLQDLDKSQVATFVSRWYDLALSDRPDDARERRERILKSFGESASIRQLAGNPMLLTIMAIIGKHQELPRERWRLYDHAASVLIEHWDVNKHLKDQRVQADFIGANEKKELLRRLAYAMQNGEGGLAGNYIHREDLEKEFVSYLRERYDQPAERATTIGRAIIEQFRERNFILSLYGASLYGFVHRAFLEYFCAAAFVHKFEKTQELTLDELKRDVYGEHWEDRNWHEVLRLICGMIDEKFTGEIVGCLIDEPRQPRPEEYETRPPWNIALAVACLSEVDNLSTVAEPAEQLLRRLCALFDESMKQPSKLGEFLYEHVVAFVEVIGPTWPNRTVLIDWISEVKPPVSLSYYGEQAFARFVGAIGRRLEAVHEALLALAVNDDYELRVLALTALVEGWSADPRTLPLLRHCVVTDADWYIRHTAIYVLAGHYRDEPGIFPLIRDRGLNDENRKVRQTAAAQLAWSYRDNPESMPLLADRAISDRDAEVRSWAVEFLVTYFGDRPQVFDLVRDQAVDDESPAADEPENKYCVRALALQSIAKCWPTHPGTLPLLLDRAENDPTPWLREMARDLAKELSKR